MNIRNTRELKRFAAERLENARDVKRILLVYVGLILGLAALTTVSTYVLDLQVDRFGGLRHLSTRKILSSVQSMLPMAQSLLNMLLNVGLLSAMMRIARGQYVSVNSLRMGMDRFWVLLRCSLIKGLLYSAVVGIGVYIGIMLFMITPLSDSAVELLQPYLSETSLLNSQVVLDDAAYAAFSDMMWPAYLICGAVIAGIGLPMLYSYRMVNYVIIDKPALGAMAALRESKQMMRGNRFAMFKLDLSMWWYYLALAAAYLICYGDMVLPMVGIQLPWNETVSYFVFFFVYLAVSFGIYYTMLSRVEVTYALAYDAVKPEEKKDTGVVLGNIFQM